MFHYIAGNHDRLLLTAPAAQQRIADALGLPKLVLHKEMEFRDHGVLAYHGNAGDAINASPDGDATIGDAIGSELILRFPRKLRALVGADHPGIEEIDDIDDVRPVYAVPAWVRQQSAIRPELFKPIREVWSEVVEEFLANDFVSRWLKTQHKTFSLDLGKKLRLLLELSRNRVIQHGCDERMTQLYRFIQHSFDGKMAALAATELSRRRGLRYVVNGHSHFPSMQPLGRIGDRPAVVLQHRHVARGPPDRSRPRRSAELPAVRRDELPGVLSHRRQARARLRVVDRRDGQQEIGGAQATFK